MPTTIADLRTRAALIGNATQVGENTANRVGTAFNMVADLLEGLQGITNVSTIDIDDLDTLKTLDDMKSSTPNIYTIVKTIGSNTFKLGTLFQFANNGRYDVAQVIVSQFIPDAMGDITTTSADGEVHIYYRICRTQNQGSLPTPVGTWTQWTEIGSDGGGGITIDPYPINGSTNAVSSGGVFEKLQDAAPLVDIEDIDDIDDYADMQAGVASYYTAKKTISGNDYRVGTLMVFANQGRYIIYQILATDYDLDANGDLDTSSSTNGGMKLIWRMKQFSGVPPQGVVLNQWSSWRYMVEPNNEDIDYDAQGRLQFADKMYEPTDFSGLGRFYIRKNIQNVGGVDKNVLTSAYLSEANFIYIIQYDFDLNGQTISLPAGCVLQFNGGSISNGTLLFNNTFLINPSFSGVTFGGTCLNNEALQDWFASADEFIGFLNNVGGVTKYIFKKGTYNVQTRITKSVESTIIIEGNGAELVYDNLSSNTAVYIKPTELDSTITKTISANAAKGDTTIYLDSVSDLNIGDYVSIRDEAVCSYSFYRDYRQGEYAIIIAVDTINSAVKLNHGLMGDYAATTSKLYGFNTINVEIDNFSVIAQDQDYAYLITQAKGLLRNVVASGFFYGIRLAHSCDFLITDCSTIFEDKTYGSSAAGYGISIANCQNIEIIGGSYTALHHAISIGGTYSGELDVINRMVSVRSVIARSVRSGWAALDCHGNCEYITFDSNYTGGIDFGGKNITITNNTCFGTRPIWGYELISLNNRIENNKGIGVYIVLENSTFDGQVTTNWKPETGKELLVIRGNRFNSESSSYGTSLKITNSVSTIYTNINNVEVLLEGNVFEKNLTMNIYTSFGDSSAEAKNNLTGKITYKDNYFNTDNNIVANLVSKDIIFDGCTFVEQKSYIATFSSTLVVRNCELRNAEAKPAITPAMALGKLVVKNNMVLCGYLVNTTQAISVAIVDNNIIDYSNDKARVVSLTYNGAETCRAFAFNNKMRHAWQLNIGAWTSFSYGGNHSMADGTLMKPNNTATAVFPDNTHFGNTANRPTLNSSAKGVTYYDTSIPKLILWNGSAWVNLDGTSL